MSIGLIITDGLGTGSFSGEISGVILSGYSIGSIWADASTNASVYTYVDNQIQTTWDVGATTWDLIGNVRQTVWDALVITYNDTTPTTPTYTDA